MSPAEVYRALCEVPDLERTVARLPSYHLTRAMRHCKTLPDTGVPALVRTLCEQRAVELYLVHYPTPSTVPPFPAL